MSRVIKVRRGDELFLESSGSLFIVEDYRNGYFEGMASDEYDDEIGDYVNYKPVWLTAMDLARELPGHVDVVFYDEL